MSTPLVIIYISGAGLRSAIWDGVRAKVTVKDAVLTHTRDNTTNLESVVQEALAQLDTIQAKRYVLVAHSVGGVIGVELARKLGDKLAGFIAVSATIPASGKSFVSTLPFPQRLLMPIILTLAGTRPPASAIRKTLCSDLTDAQADRIVEAFTPEPRKLYVDKTSSDKLPSAKYAYIRTLNDKQVSPQLQSSMAQLLPNVTITDIAGGHLSMVSHPDELADSISSFLKDLSVS
ncbi:MAG TPA: alpha/beta hydrolase [Patescibacteria group bacterium]|nr:alpha/beta hydrolase [Patescibacteria group bacterium]